MKIYVGILYADYSLFQYMDTCIQGGYILPVQPITTTDYHKVLSIRTDKSQQTVKTRIRLLLEEQSDQVYNVCLPSTSFEHAGLYHF